MVSAWLFHGYKGLLTLLACTIVESSILRGPNNIVGIFDQDVTLKCRSNESQKVEWTFTRFGESAAVNESKFPGHHSTSYSTRGHHSLTLENLKFDNAGRYVCRVVGTSSGAVDATAAFVIVVANPPHCTYNTSGRPAYNDTVDIQCSVMFVGQYSLKLEWLAPDGHLLSRQHYWSGDRGYVARLPLSVKVPTSLRYNLSMAAYECRASFGNRTTQYADEASNSPQFRRNTCAVLLHFPNVSPIDASTYTPPSVTSSRIALMAAVCLLVGALLVVVIIISVCVYRNKAKTQSAARRCSRSAEGGLSDNEDNPSNDALCDSQTNNATGGLERAPLMITESEDDQCRVGEAISPDDDGIAGREAVPVTDTPVTVQPLNELDQRSLSEAPGPERTEAAAAGSRPRSDDLLEQQSMPMTDINRQQSDTNLSDSANYTTDSATGHDDTGLNMFDLHADSETDTEQSHV